MPSYQHRKSHCGDKTIVRSSYLHNGISYTGKMTSLYWIGALYVTLSDTVKNVCTVCKFRVVLQRTRIIWIAQKWLAALGRTIVVQGMIRVRFQQMDIHNEITHAWVLVSLIIIMVIKSLCSRKDWIYEDNRMICRDVSGLVTGYPCGVWCRGSTTSPCMLGHFLANLFWHLICKFK